MKLTQMVVLLELLLLELLLLLLLYVFDHVLLRGREAPPLELRNKYIQQKQQQQQQQLQHQLHLCQFHFSFNVVQRYFTLFRLLYV